MKTSTKTKSNSYKNLMIQDESGIDFIKVSKQIWKSLSASRTLHISTKSHGKSSLA